MVLSQGHCLFRVSESLRRELCSHSGTPSQTLLRGIVAVGDIEVVILVDVFIGGGVVGTCVFVVVWAAICQFYSSFDPAAAPLGKRLNGVVKEPINSVTKAIGGGIGKKVAGRLVEGRCRCV